MKTTSVCWFPVVALIVSLDLLACNGSSGGNGVVATTTTTVTTTTIVTTSTTTTSTTTTTLQSGSLDPSFGTGGIVTTPVTTSATSDATAYALAIQSNEKLVTAGISYSYNSDFTVLTSVLALARYNTDGGLDATFGTGGIVTTAIGASDSAAFALAIQSDGKLVAAGYTNTGTSGTPINEFLLVRYNTDGTLDTTFGTNGIATTAVGTSDDSAFALAIQSDGKLVAAGYSLQGSQLELALVRYNTDGTLDTTFNATGIVTTAIGTVQDEARALVIQSDGKLLAGGKTNNGTDNDFALVRYNTDGSLDTTFNTTGIVTTDIASFNNAAFALAIQSDGKLVAAGQTDTIDLGGPQEFALIRYNTDGSLDTTFNPTGSKPGVVTTAIRSNDDEARALAIQSDGKLVVAGYSDSNSAYLYDFALVRYNTNGNLDSTFGTGGIVTTAIGSGSDFSRALIIQPDGKIVAAGEANYNGVDYDFALTRYSP